MEKTVLIVRTLLEVAAIGLIAYGVGLIFFPLAPIVAGVALLAALYNSES